MNPFLIFALIGGGYLVYKNKQNAAANTPTTPTPPSGSSIWNYVDGIGSTILNSGGNYDLPGGGSATPTQIATSDPGQASGNDDDSDDGDD